MALSGKLEETIELKSPPEKFYQVWTKEAHQIPNHTPGHFQDVKVHEGDWETHGSIRIWNYSAGGKVDQVFKERVEFDDETMTITLNGIEGHVMDDYKVYKPIYKLAPKGTGTLATMIIEYEKKNDAVPAPDLYMEVMANLTREIDESLVKAASII